MVRFILAGTGAGIGLLLGLVLSGMVLVESELFASLEWEFALLFTLVFVIGGSLCGYRLAGNSKS